MGLITGFIFIVVLVVGALRTPPYAGIAGDLPSIRLPDPAHSAFSGILKLALPAFGVEPERTTQPPTPAAPQHGEATALGEFLASAARIRFQLLARFGYRVPDAYAISALQRDLATRDIQLSACEGDVAAGDNELDVCEGDVTARDIQLNACKDDATARDIELRACKADVTTRDIMLSGYKRNVADLAHQLGSCRGNVGAKDNQLSMLDKERKSLEARLKAADERHERLAAAYRNMRQKAKAKELALEEILRQKEKQLQQARIEFIAATLLLVAVLAVFAFKFLLEEDKCNELRSELDEAWKYCAAFFNMQIKKPSLHVPERVAEEAQRAASRVKPSTSRMLREVLTGSSGEDGRASMASTLARLQRIVCRPAKSSIAEWQQLQLDPLDAAWGRLKRALLPLLALMTRMACTCLARINEGFIAPLVRTARMAAGHSRPFSVLQALRSAVAIAGSMDRIDWRGWQQGVIINPLSVIRGLASSVSIGPTRLRGLLTRSTAQDDCRAAA